MKVGFLGTGLMGKPMVERLKSLDYEVVAYNRSVEKTKSLAEIGVEISNSPTEVLLKTDCILLMLTDINAIKSLLFTDVDNKNFVGKTIIQMGTIAPYESQELCKIILDSGGDYLEAPVLGSISEAQTGKLIVMLGATSKQFTEWLELLKVFSSKPILVGEVGKASALKLALNQLIASLTASFSLSLAFVQASKVDVNIFMEILRQSALYAPTFDKKLNRFLSNDYSNPNFPVKHLEKDTRLFLEAASKYEINDIVLKAVHQLLVDSVEAKAGDLDYSAIFNSIYKTRQS